MKNKVFVGGLDWNTSEAGLEAAFNKYGQVTEAKIITDRESGRSRGFGFVTFASASDAEYSVRESDGKELDGRALRVNLAEEKRPRDSGSYQSSNRGSRW